MRKTKKVLALLLAAVLIVGTGVNNKGLLTVQAETTTDTGTTVSDKDATTPTEVRKETTTSTTGTTTTTEDKTQNTTSGTDTTTSTEKKTDATTSGKDTTTSGTDVTTATDNKSDTKIKTDTTTPDSDTITSAEEKTEEIALDTDATAPTDKADETTLTDAQQAFVDAVSALDKASILELVNAYKENANEETEAAFYAEYDKVEGFDTSAYELYQALSEDEKSEVSDSYATLKDIMDSVATILDSKVSDEASTYLNEDTVATVGTTEYTASTFIDAILASSESNPVEVVNDFLLPNHEDGSNEGNYYINLNNHTISCEGYFRISLSTMHLKGNGIISVPHDKNIYFKDLIMENITVRGDNIGILCDSLFMNNCSNTEGYIDIFLPKAQKDSKISGNNTIKKISINTSGLTSENKLIIEEGAILNVTDKITCMLVIENNGTVNVKSIVGKDQARFINNDTLNCEEINIGESWEAVTLTNNTGKMTINKIVGAEGYGMPGGGGSLNIINSQDLFLEFTDTSSTWDSVTINNAGTTYLNGNASSASSHITNTGSGKVMKLINAIAVTGVATPVAGTAFEHRASTANEEIYSASVDYYIGDAKVTDTNAGFGKTYTAKVTVTPGDGYGFLEAPSSALLNNSTTTPVLNADGTVTLTYTFPNATAKAKLTGITTPTAITGVSNGTAKDAASLGLPSTVTITTEAGDQTAEVTWAVASSSYDITKTAAQEFTVTGTITLPEGVEQNGQSLDTIISVSVKAKPTSSSSGNSSGSGSSSSGSSSSSSNSNNNNNTTPSTVTPTVPIQPTTGITNPTVTPDTTTTVKPVTPTKTVTDEGNQKISETVVISDNGTKGWDVVTDKAASAASGTITVDMGGSTKVPGTVIDSIKGKDVNVVFELGDGISWTVNGKTVTKDNLGDIDFGVSTDAKTIPVDVVNNITGEKYSMEISIAYDGEFGFTAVLGVELDTKNAGMYANLFYYAPEATDLEFICSSLIDDSGIAQMEFTHASDYVIVVDKESMDPQNLVAEAGTEESVDTTDATPTTITEADSTRDSGNSTVVLWIAIILVLALGITAFVVVKKKQKDTE